MVEWIEVLSTDSKLLEIGAQYQINPLVLEDCLHRDQDLSLMITGLISLSFGLCLPKENCTKFNLLFFLKD